MVTLLLGLDGFGSSQFQAGPELIAFHPGRFPQLDQAGPLGLVLSLHDDGCRPFHDPLTSRTTLAERRRVQPMIPSASRVITSPDEGK